MAKTARPTRRKTPSDPESRVTARDVGAPASPTPERMAEESAAIYPDSFDTPPTADEIAREAYSIYLARGGDPGQDMNDWLEAERRVTARRREQQNRSE